MNACKPRCERLDSSGTCHKCGSVWKDGEWKGINMKKRGVRFRWILRRLVNWYCYDGGFWLRIMGRGISVVNRQKHPQLFSERDGYRRGLRVGKWAVEWLPSNTK